MENDRYKPPFYLPSSQEGMDALVRQLISDILSEHYVTEALNAEYERNLENYLDALMDYLDDDQYGQDGNA